MGLDIKLFRVLQCVWDGGTTHNMVKMANEIPVRCIKDKPITAFCYIWDPHNLGIFLAKDMIEPLHIIISSMLLEYDSLIKFNPENGWGSYNVFLRFLVDYFLACKENPESYIEVYI